MKKSYWPLTYLILLLFVFLLLPGLTQAQPNPECGPDNPCPIDSGLVALIAVGIGYGIKKIRDQRKVETLS